MGAVLAAGGGGLGGFLAGTTGAAAGAALGAGCGALLDRRLAARWTRRRKALGEPFPEAWRVLLRDRYDHYDRLPEAERGRFEDDLRIFLAETRLTGVGIEATEELRLLVAASAVTLSLGWRDFEWDRVPEVLLYPDDFDRDYNFGGDDRAGEAHAWGTVIFSVPALLESFADPDDGYHVGLHEFAHLLDLEQSDFDGIPAGLPAPLAEQWAALARREMDRLRRRKSVLDPYGAEDPVEFLAVSIEAFFETPLALRARHQELYGLLRTYFGQDPASWDDARGLYLP
jgi:Mlc titration factor MtfA (ptsG expression regulator)